MIGVVAAPFLAELQIVDRREFGVLRARLTALEVFEVDLGDLDAGVAHEPRGKTAASLTEAITLRLERYFSDKG